MKHCNPGAGDQNLGLYESKASMLHPPTQGCLFLPFEKLFICCYTLDEQNFTFKTILKSVRVCIYPSWSTQIYHHTGPGGFTGLQEAAPAQPSPVHPCSQWAGKWFNPDQSTHLQLQPWMKQQKEWLGVTVHWRVLEKELCDGETACCTAWCGSHQPRVANEHLKRDMCDPSFNFSSFQLI